MIVDFLKQADIKIETNNEFELQNDIEHIFKEIGVEYIREHNFDKHNRVDFLVGDTAIECKVQGSSLSVFRQLERYSYFAKEIVLISSKRFSMPEQIRGVPIHIVKVDAPEISGSNPDKEFDAFVKIEGSNILLREYKPYFFYKFKKWFNTKRDSIPFNAVNAFDILWFGERYDIKFENYEELSDKAQERENDRVQYQYMLSKNYKPKPVPLKEPYKLREYQQRFVDITLQKKKILLCDDTGLGKTPSGISVIAASGKIPGLIVCQTHLQTQWAREVEKFTDFKTHIISKMKFYELPEADIYIITYTKLSAWEDYLSNHIKTVIYDECQQFRGGSLTNKGSAAMAITNNAEFSIGLTATPIYNYGDEIHNTLSIVVPHSFDNMSYWDFIGEWCHLSGTKYKVSDPKALGDYIKDSGWMVRRTRKDVNLELDPVNMIYKEVEPNRTTFNKYQKRLKALSLGYLDETDFVTKGQIARELNSLARLVTGISKADSVADEVTNILESENKVVLVGWHRDVYNVWLHKLRQFNPVMYTGSETPQAKQKSLDTFLNDDDCKVFIMSLRSGEGLNGLQDVCSTMVFGELDWSPQVHYQIISRLSRDGQENTVNAIFCSLDGGVDPIMLDVLGVKNAQSTGIMNSNDNVVDHNDYEKLHKLAEKLSKRG